MSRITLEYLKANASALLPHIEERALELSHKNTPILQHCLIKDDLSGWVDRKVSSYLDSDDATELSEATDIPTGNIYRARLATSTPKEWGRAYDLTDRRIESDPSGILSTAITYLGKGLRNRIEEQLFNSAYSSFVGGEFGGATESVTLASLLGIMTYANHVSRSPGDLLFMFHPYQVHHLIHELLAISSGPTVAGDDARKQGAAFSNLQYIPNLYNNTMRIPNVGLLSMSDNVPRNVSYKLRIYGAGGTFRLQIGEGGLVVPDSNRSLFTKYNITTALAGNISAANFKIALDALNMGAWTVALASNVYTLTPPADLYLNDRYQLRPAIKLDAADDVTLDSYDGQMYVQKSAYDKITGTSPHTGTTPTDVFGTALGFKLEELNGCANAVVFKRNALLFDPRKPAKLNSDDKNDGRTLRLSYYQVFGTAGWEAREGFTYMTYADLPV